MKCPNCRREFNPNRPYRKYCSRECYKKSTTVNQKRREMARIKFEVEWAAWKRDFALGKTVSNQEATA